MGGKIGLRLANNIGEDIRITSFSATNDAVSPLGCGSPPGLPIDWAKGTEQDFVFSGCQNGAFIIGERTDAKITMKYCSPATAGCPEHAVIGKITAIVIRP